jgi:hypothetical protein
MNQLYLPNFFVNSGTSGVLAETSLTISWKSAAPEIDLLFTPVAPVASELSYSSFVASITPDKPIKATVVDSNSSSV